MILKFNDTSFFPLLEQDFWSTLYLAMWPNVNRCSALFFSADFPAARTMALTKDPLQAILRKKNASDL